MSAKMKKYIEHVVIRDYGRNGLALFILDDGRVNPGNINCWSGVIDYSSIEKPGFRPDIDSTPMCYEEASMGYFYKGKLVYPQDPRVPAFVERYRQFAQPAYVEQPCELEVRVVLRDSAKYRHARWQR